MFLTNSGMKLKIKAADGSVIEIHHGRHYYDGAAHDAIMGSAVLWAAHDAGRITIEAIRPEKITPVVAKKAKPAKKSAKSKKAKKAIKVG